MFVFVQSQSSNTCVYVYMHVCVCIIFVVSFCLSLRNIFGGGVGCVSVCVYLCMC